MVLVEINDQDTTINNIMHVAEAKATEFKRWLMEIKGNNPTATVKALGEGRYQITLEAIDCTGADVNTRFNIPLMHQLIMMEIKHTDVNDADSIDALAYSVSKRPHPNLWMLLLNIEETTASDIMDEYEDFYRTLGEYLLVTNSTITDKLQINVTIRVTGA